MAEDNRGKGFKFTDEEKTILERAGCDLSPSGNTIQQGIFRLVNRVQELETGLKNLKDSSDGIYALWSEFSSEIDSRSIHELYWLMKDHNHNEDWSFSCATEKAKELLGATREVNNG